MKKIFLLIIGIFAAIGNLQSQDLIVTDSGDSINCKITKVTKDYVYFTFKYDTEIRKTLLSVNQISVQQKDYFSVSELPADYSSKADFPQFRFAIDVGWQYRLAKMAGELNSYEQEHVKKMRSGFNYDLQVAWFFNEMMGIEAMFSRQFFGNVLENVTYSIGNQTASGLLDEQIKFNYYGANYIIRLFDSKKNNCFLMTVGFGYLGYDDKIFINDRQFNQITAGTLGTSMSFGYDIGISENVDLGFKLSLTGGSFRTFKRRTYGITTTETLPENYAEGLGTIKLSVGFRFNK